MSRDANMPMCRPTKPWNARRRSRPQALELADEPSVEPMTSTRMELTLSSAAIAQNSAKSVATQMRAKGSAGASKRIRPNTFSHPVPGRFASPSSRSLVDEWRLSMLPGSSSIPNCVTTVERFHRGTIGRLGCRLGVSDRSGFCRGPLSTQDTPSL